MKSQDNIEDFDPEDSAQVDNILEQNNVTFVCEYMEAYKGNFVTLIWPHGVWALPYREVNDKCKQHAALFCFLWLKNVGLPLSDQLAYAFVKQNDKCPPKEFVNDNFA